MVRMLQERHSAFLSRRVRTWRISLSGIKNSLQGLTRWGRGEGHPRYLRTPLRGKSFLNHTNLTIQVCDSLWIRRMLHIVWYTVHGEKTRSRRRCISLAPFHNFPQPFPADPLRLHLLFFFSSPWSVKCELFCVFVLVLTTTYNFLCAEKNLNV